MAGPFPTWQTIVGLAKETTWGTGVAPTTADQFVPISNPKPELVIDPLYDRGYRGRASQDQGWQQGFKSSKYSFDAQFHPDVCGNWFMGIMGIDGWASGTTHPFTVQNASLPPSYTVQDFYGITGSNSRSYTGLYFDSLSMSGTDKGPLKASVSLSGGNAPVLVAKPTAVYTTAVPFRTWDGALTLNSVLKTNLISYDLTLKRTVNPISAMGTQNPTAANAFQLEATGKMSFYTTADTEYLLYETANQAAFPASIVFTNGSNTLTIVMTTCQFEAPTTFDRGTDYVKTMVTFRGIDNATDAGCCKITLVGGKSGSSY